MAEAVFPNREHAYERRLGNDRREGCLMGFIARGRHPGDKFLLFFPGPFEARVEGGPRSNKHVFPALAHPAWQKLDCPAISEN